MVLEYLTVVEVLHGKAVHSDQKVSASASAMLIILMDVNVWNSLGEGGRRPGEEGREYSLA